jgi:hypothetical protein
VLADQLWCGTPVIQAGDRVYFEGGKVADPYSGDSSDEDRGEGPRMSSPVHAISSSSGVTNAVYWQFAPSSPSRWTARG